MKEKIQNIINDTIYSQVGYPHLGNNYILTANWILYELGCIKDIDIICKLAKIIEKHSTYDHEISENDLNIIIKLTSNLIKKYKNKQSKLI